MRAVVLGAVLVLSQGCFPSHGSAGMDLDRDGNLVIARVWENEILVVDRTSGAVLERLSSGVSSPDDVAVAPDGRFVWTSLFASHVATTGSADEAASVLAEGRGVNGIAFAADGRLFVSRCFLGDALWEIDPVEPGEPRIVAENLGRDCALNGMTFGPDGLLYGAQPTLGRVVRLDVETGELEVLVEGLGDKAYAVAFTPQGELLALRDEEVVRVDPLRSEFSTYAALPFTADNLVVAPDGELFASSAGTGEVIAFSATGAQRTVIPGGAW